MILVWRQESHRRWKRSIMLSDSGTSQVRGSLGDHSKDFCRRPGYALVTVRDNILTKQGKINVTSKIVKIIVQQGDTDHKQLENKKQIKTMISTISCNPIVINHQVHRSNWRSQILEGSGREKKMFHVCLQKYTLSTC